ncbi:DUF4834 domain-containing protein [Mucilaginibacter galii]|uniref:DUF4834 family protein n=1 Tax=Mucilaginibacter galii TaxID=2005073 RepID=A0A917N490_9SPHI|nr:DUF4834 family protein [Mucilaginibacter galii]GGI51832.1 hypothetical protein GCM10011425_30440 [Mucilaginibacter galii]
MLLIRFLIITVCVLWLIRTLARIFLPMLFQSMVNKATQQHNQPYQQQPPRQAEGKVKVDFVPPGPKNTIPDNEGDFVDYEEVK